jgi:hypothetical protein
MTNWNIDDTDPLVDFQEAIDDALNNVGMSNFPPTVADDVIEASTTEEVKAFSQENGLQVQILRYSKYGILWGITSDKEVKIYYSYPVGTVPGYGEPI